jgi:hypothetical protein
MKLAWGKKVDQAFHDKVFAPDSSPPHRFAGWRT